ncbi:MAG: response regulator [Thermodesulfobacteriota bacterium]
MHEILLVDDDSFFLKQMVKDLQRSDYRVRTAENGASAMNLLARRRFDLVITDLKMESVDGFEVLQTAKAIHPVTQVIIFTGYGDLSAAVKALRLHADDFILKSCDLEELWFRIDRCLDHSRLKKQILEAEQALVEANADLEQKVRQRTDELENLNRTLQQTHQRMVTECERRTALSKRLIELLEMDRRQIARELHDQVGQALTSLKINLELLLCSADSAEVPPEWTDRIQSARNRAVQAITDIKNLSHGLRPSLLDSLGLLPALRELFHDIQDETDIRIEFFSDTPPVHFNEEKELALYRIIQEAVNNAVKHADTPTLHISLIRKGGEIVLSIEDSGTGFCPEKVLADQSTAKPLGLVIMRERAVQAGGDFFIESQKGRGTLILARIPID